MAISKVILVSLFLSMLVLQQVQALQINQETSNTVSESKYYKPQMNCGGACAARCKLSSRPNLCKRACGTCCSRCNCVPSGTYGNYGECECYAKMTTRGNRRKCP